ncbi:MAG: hypothetical protein L3J37_02485 [Rhodobacteraceae bacterium]|nr:hypothetical protein [Paracoccaceae bacterium]
MFRKILIWPNILAVSVMSFTSFANSQEVEIATLGEFIESVDRTPVSFKGFIKFDPSEDRFVFYNENWDYFGVSMDAGRTAREQIEQNCAESGFLISRTELCQISASGTVEIRGGQVFLSIEKVDSLTP